MKHALRILATLVAAILGGIVPTTSAAVAATPAVVAYAYDGHHYSAARTHDATERGPPASTYDYTVHPLAVDFASYGPSEHPDAARAWIHTTFDQFGRFAHGDNAAATSWTVPGVRTTAACAVSGVRCAANAGPRALPIGPWGQKIVDARTKLPSSWGTGTPNAKGVGTRWFDPANKGNGIRIDQGLPGSSFPSQQVDHVVVRSGGRILGPDGKPIVGSLSQNPQAHIPLSDWLTWSSWSTP